MRDLPADPESLLLARGKFETLQVHDLFFTSHASLWCAYRPWLNEVKCLVDSIPYTPLDCTRDDLTVFVKCLSDAVQTFDCRCSHWFLVNTDPEPCFKLWHNGVGLKGFCRRDYLSFYDARSVFLRFRLSDVYTWLPFLFYGLGLSSLLPGSTEQSEQDIYLNDYEYE